MSKVLSALISIVVPTTVIVGHNSVTGSTLKEYLGEVLRSKREIRYVTATLSSESRKTIRLGKCDRKSAESICRHVEALLAAKIGGQPVPRDTAAWLAGIGATLRDKLAAVGLVEAPKRALLGEFLKHYVLSRPDVKPATLEVWQQPCRNLKEFFGEDKPLRSITCQPARKRTRSRMCRSR